MKKNLLFIAPLLLTSPLALSSPTTLTAEGVPIANGVRLFSDIGVRLEHNDNITQQSTNEISSFITVLTPEFTLDSKQRSSSYSLMLRPEIGRYFSSSADNYEDLKLLATGDWQIGRLIDFTLRGQYLKEHDARGSLDYLNLGEPYKWDQFSIGGLFSYGRSTAKFRIEAELNQLIKRYDDLVSEDKDLTDISARFFYRVLPKTRIFFEASHKLIDYQSSSSSLDNNLSNYSVGATWQATKKTTGKAQIGYLNKDFDSAAREDFSGVSWNVSMQWVPMSRSTFEFATSRMPFDSSGLGDYLLYDNFSVKWTHSWKERISTTLGLSLANVEYEGKTGSVVRTDDTDNIHFLVNYNLKKWLGIETGVYFTERDSTHDYDDFDRVRWVVMLKAVF